ncbi:MAG TPA: hypothetical protein VLT85_07020 [Terriglobales bacterium]|nr:hypothetical protein [Terriglobales bacterium]
MADYVYMMESRLTPEQQRAVAQVQEMARAQEFNLYLTGGAVRDMISGFPIRDLDFTVQGNALRLHKDLEKAGVAIQGVDEELKSLLVQFPGNVRAEISMARAEKYGEKAGKPPEIEPSTIIEDLRRRDFTINAMALSLNEGSRGLLLDPANGLADIEAKLIRILQNYAFVEEPSRLIRATRFASRFHWTLEERTQARYDSARENDYIQYITDRAIGYEIGQVAYEDDPLHIMKALEKEGWLKVLNPHWTVSKVDTSGLASLLKIRRQMVDLGYNLDAAPAAMYFLTRRLGSQDVAAMQRLIPRKGFVEAWRHLEDEAKELAQRLVGKEAATPSRTWKLLSNSRPESILFLSLTARPQKVVQKLRNFFGKWRQLKSKIPLPEMVELRITPELEIYPQLEKAVFELLLDGKMRTHSQAMKFLKPFAPPPPPPPPPPPAKRGRAAKAEAAPPAKPEAGKKKGEKVAVAPPAAKAAEPARRPAPAATATEPAKKPAPAAQPSPKKAPAKPARRPAKAKAGKKKPAKKRR